MKRNGFDQAAAIVAAISSMAVALSHEPLVAGFGDPWVALASAIGGGAASWLVFPWLARNSGWAEVVADLFKVGFAIGLAGAIAGTLLVPIFGTVLGIGQTLILPIQYPKLAFVYAFGTAAALALARAKKLSAYS